MDDVPLKALPNERLSPTLQNWFSFSHHMNIRSWPIVCQVQIFLFFVSWSYETLHQVKGVS